MSYRFENPAAFQLLWLIPLIIFLGVYLAKAQHKKIMKSLGERLSPFLTASLSTKKRKWKMALEAFVVLCFVLALARPQSGKSTEEVKSEGVEMMLLVDVSKSMLAEDAKPSRLELAKIELERLLEKAAGDRMGLIAFAGSAILLSPMTGDKGALKMYIESLAPSAVSSQGTEFRKALREAKSAFNRGGIEEGEGTVVTRVVVVASDGENNEPGAMDAAKELVDQGVRVFTLGVGTEKGSPIPIRDEFGNLQGYHKDPSGQVVMSKTKGTVLKELAQEGRGSFYHMTFGGNAINRLYQDIKQLEQSEFETAELVNYEEKYQWFLGLGLLLGLIELLLGERRGPGRIWKGRFEVSEQ